MSFTQNLSENTVFYEIRYTHIGLHNHTYIFPCVVFSICKLENSNVFGFLDIRF